MAKVAARIPWHVRVVSVALIIVGFGNAFFWFAALFEYGGAQVSIGSVSWWLVLITSVALIVIGAGLWRRKRWAWMAGMIVYVLSLARGLWVVAFYGDGVDRFWIGVLPSILVLWSLAAPRTRRAFLD